MGVALPRVQSVAELAARLGGSVDAAVRERRVAHLAVPAEASNDGDLVVLTSRRHVPAALAAAGVILCAEELASRVPEGRRWIHSHAMWVVTQLLGELPAGDCQPVRDVQVHSGAEVASSVVLGAGAVVMKGARIGAQCVIGENAVVYGRVSLGARVTVGPLSVIGRSA